MIGDLYAECDWDERTLSLFLPELPDEIAVRRTDSRNRSAYSARVHRYLPERTARKVTVWNHDTDHATGHSECAECGESVNPCAKWCEHCGCKFEGDE